MAKTLDKTRMKLFVVVTDIVQSIVELTLKKFWILL